MPHHFTKSTVEASFWCKKCGKDTPHEVWDGRRGGCLTCRANPTLIDVVPPPAEQLELGKAYGEIEIK